MSATTAVGVRRLRTYQTQLARRYGDALVRRRFDQARAIRDLRWRVRRAILLGEEWGAAGSLSADYDELLRN